MKIINNIIGSKGVTEKQFERADDILVRITTADGIVAKDLTIIVDDQKDSVIITVGGNTNVRGQISCKYSIDQDGKVTNLNQKNWSHRKTLKEIHKLDK